MGGVVLGRGIMGRVGDWTVRLRAIRWSIDFLIVGHDHSEWFQTHCRRYTQDLAMLSHTRPQPAETNEQSSSSVY